MAHEALSFSDMVIPIFQGQPVHLHRIGIGWSVSGGLVSELETKLLGFCSPMSLGDRQSSSVLVVQLGRFDKPFIEAIGYVLEIKDLVPQSRV